jgi:hypothetical protein
MAFGMDVNNAMRYNLYTRLSNSNVKNYSDYNNFMTGSWTNIENNIAKANQTNDINQIYAAFGNKNIYEDYLRRSQMLAKMQGGVFTPVNKNQNQNDWTGVADTMRNLTNYSDYNPYANLRKKRGI